MNFLKITPEKENEVGFKEIARILFDQYAIQKNDQLYRLIEIEFYWNSPKHVDDTTYKRKHIDPKSGEWFFHYSGVDIALRNEMTGGFGGILIRGLYNLNEDIDQKERIIKGPMVCAMKLFSGFDAFYESIKTKIIKHQNPSKTIDVRRRKNIGKNGEINNAKSFNYAFSIDPKK